MTETPPNPPDMLPPTEEFVAFHQRRNQLFALLTCAISLVCAISVFGLGVETLILPFVILLSFMVLVGIWNYPIFTFYILFLATLLFEMGISNSPDAIVEKVPFFLNINTMVQTYAHVDFKALPINLPEVILALTGAVAAIRAAFNHEHKVRFGPLWWPIFAYIAFVTIGWVNGMLTGGDFKISLQEVRPQFYFMTAYFMAVNFVRTPRHLHKLYWLIVLGVALKGIIYTIRRYTIYAGQPLPDGGVGSHEEAFFFDCFEMLFLVLAFTNIQKPLRRLMWFLLPFIVLGNLATNRRAGTAAFIIVFPILLMAAYRVLPKYRKSIAIFSVIAAFVLPAYYFTFRHSESMIAQPARAVASQFEASSRDSASNAYRDAENADLMATIHLAPIQGYGYGKKMLHVVPIADISQIYEYWDIMTHNQVLWVWMRVGSFGMFSFWMMIAAIIIRACLNIRDEKASIETKAASIYGMLVICMLMFFGLLDLQFSNFRDMLFGGFWAGIVAIAPQFKDSDPQQEKQEKEVGA